MGGGSRIPLGKPLQPSSCAVEASPSGADLDFPCRRERSKVPYIVRQCVEEIERRGMEEVGIYRVSGVATDIQALKAAFDVSEYLLLRLLFPLRKNVVQRSSRISPDNRSWQR